jgi:hypothetical protein
MAMARQITAQQHEANWPAYSRFSMVACELVQLFEAGRLGTGVRNPEGGKVSPLDRSYWNGESVLARFVTCRIHSARPFDWTPALQDGLPLFIERLAFDKYVAQLTPALAAPHRMHHGDEFGEHVSEYVRFMVEQSICLGLSPHSEPKHAELMAMLSDAWGGREPPLSSRLLSAMATLMRSSQSQVGRGRVRAKG